MTTKRKSPEFPDAAPEEVLQCIWMMAGVVKYKLCDRAYNCEACPLDEAMRGQPSWVPSAETPALFRSPPSNRLRVSLEADRTSAWPWRPPSCEVSTDLFYDSRHRWVRVEEGGTAKIGLDDFGQQLLGTIYSVEAPRSGSRISEDKAPVRFAYGLGEISLPLPVEGEVVWVNEALLRRPSLINTDPYGEGAVLAVLPAHLVNDLRPLSYGFRAGEWMKRELENLAQRLAELLSGSRPGIGETLPDGGKKLDDLFRLIHSDSAFRPLVEEFLTGSLHKSQTLSG